MESEACYDGTLEGFFALLDQLWGLPVECRPRRVIRSDGFSAGFPGGEGQGSLFDPPPPGGLPRKPPKRPGNRDSYGFFQRKSHKNPQAQQAVGPLPDPALVGGAAGILFQVSPDAYDALVYVWMSGLSVEGEALRYALRVLSAAKKAVSGPAAGAAWYRREEARRGAALAARNRLDDDCRTVLALSGKVAHEIHRLMGFLRFSPGAGGRYIARCSPDYGVLPALASHFSTRFGDAPWAVIDEKRGLVLAGEGRGKVRLFAAGGDGPRSPTAGPSETWEELWRCYHRAVNIESRKNPSLQRRFIPSRYREYLDEFNISPAPPVEDDDRDSGLPAPLVRGNCN
ncbi:MAG: TIGR03915 family putative DNA repair protein [Treponema sp.]|jgi:probable DNA metabolism protein|nr:TIGR03915 family putative DNA repair protein [Treponema sp.]